MGKSQPATPPPPDPVKVAQAQTDSNIATARENQRLNMINTTGPYGQVYYEADPTAPGGYRQVTSLSPGQQSIYDQTTQIASDHLGRIGDALSTPLTTDGLPALVSNVDLSRLRPGEGIQNTFEHGQAVRGTFGGDLEQARRDARDAVWGQATQMLDPVFARQEASLENRLANQGLSMTSEAYDAARQQFGDERSRAYADAAYRAVAAGEDAAQGLFNRQQAQAMFENQAAAQMYGQNLGAAQFANQAQAQRFGQDATYTNFGFQNAALSNAARSQGLQERAYIANTPINQLGALLSGGQVSMPSAIQYTPTQIAPTDVIGANALSAQIAQANANRQAQAQSGLMSGLFSLGAAAIRSDRRLKTNIVKLGERADGIGVYAFDYVFGGPRQVGVMADEVEAVRPDLVITDPDGFKRVFYPGLGAL